MTLIFLIPLSVWWSIPFLILVYVARNLGTKPIWGLQTYSSRVILIACGFIGGALGMISVFVSIFIEFDPLIIFAPVWLYYIPHLAAGLFVGWLIAKGLEAYLAKTTGRKSE